MCTDNMPSGSALKLGDVLTFRNGKTAEIHNTDAEGRLILADGLALAAEEQPDAIVDIATLTGAALAALGPTRGRDRFRPRRRASGRGIGGRRRRAGVGVAARRRQVPQAARLRGRRHEERRRAVCAEPRRRRSSCREFVGDVPWAHIDIAGPMNVDGDTGWKSKGATGFGTRLLIDFATTFTPAG